MVRSQASDPARIGVKAGYPGLGKFPIRRANRARGRKMNAATPGTTQACPHGGEMLGAYEFVDTGSPRSQPARCGS